MVFPTALSIVGVVLIMIALRLFQIEADIRINGICTKAVIVDIVHQIGHDADGYPAVSYYPVLEYYVNGQVMRAKRHYGGGWLPVGKKVKVIYHKDNPEKVTIKNDYNVFLMVLLLFIIALFLIFY